MSVSWLRWRTSVPSLDVMFQSTLCLCFNSSSSERQYAIRKFGKSLLAVCDNMELALKHVPKEEVTGESANKVC